MGVFFSLIALFAWGIGDFLIQKSARKFGDWLSLFYITIFASIVLFPFVYKELRADFFNSTGLVLLLTASVVITFAAYFDFEGLRIGKISVIEPIYAFEVPITAMLATLIIGEYLSFWQIILIVVIMVGIFFVSVKSLSHFKNIKWEKGLWFAIIATMAMGASNFLFGVGARNTSPLLINWFTSVFIALVSFFFLEFQSKLGLIISDLKNNSRLIVTMSFIDNLAWVAFSYASLYIPIAVVTSISESYIALAALLGLRYNAEKLKLHQKIGLVLTVAAAIILAGITRE